MTPARFEPTVSGNEQPQTHTLDSAATGIGCSNRKLNKLILHTYVCYRRVTKSCVHCIGRAGIT
jgi:hypothetical protein